MNRYEMDKERENFRTVLKKMFSITEDAASNEEIRDRILCRRENYRNKHGRHDLCDFDCICGAEYQFDCGHHWCNARFLR